MSEHPADWPRIRAAFEELVELAPDERRARLDELLASTRGLVSEQQPLATAEAAVDLTASGDVLGEGVLSFQFGQWPAGSEEFVVAETAEGFEVRAHNKPQGGAQLPFAETVQVNSDYSFRSATWKQLTASPLEATYAVQDGVLVVETAT